jgi:hypothetical protein
MRTNIAGPIAVAASILVWLLIAGTYNGLVVILPALHPATVFPWHVRHEKFVLVSYEAQETDCIYPPGSTGCARSIAHLVGASSYVTCTVRSDEVGTTGNLALFQSLQPGQTTQYALWWINNHCSSNDSSTRGPVGNLVIWIILGCIVGNVFFIPLAFSAASMTYDDIFEYLRSDGASRLPPSPPPSLPPPAIELPAVAAAVAAASASCNEQGFQQV